MSNILAATDGIMVAMGGDTKPEGQTGIVHKILTKDKIMLGFTGHRGLLELFEILLPHMKTNISHGELTEKILNLSALYNMHNSRLLLGSQGQLTHIYPSGNEERKDSWARPLISVPNRIILASTGKGVDAALKAAHESTKSKICERIKDGLLAAAANEPNSVGEPFDFYEDGQLIKL